MAPGLISYFSNCSAVAFWSAKTSALGYLLLTSATAVCGSKTRTKKRPCKSGPPFGSGLVVLTNHPPAIPEYVPETDQILGANGGLRREAISLDEQRGTPPGTIGNPLVRFASWGR
jgi:hypothetical protein